MTAVAERPKAFKPPPFGCTRPLQENASKFSWALDENYGFLNCFHCKVCKVLLCESKTSNKYTAMKKNRADGVIEIWAPKYVTRSKVSIAYNCPSSLTCSKSTTKFSLEQMIADVHKKLPVPNEDQEGKPGFQLLKTKKTKTGNSQQLDNIEYKLFVKWLCDYVRWTIASGGKPIPERERVEEE